MNENNFTSVEFEAFMTLFIDFVLLYSLFIAGFFIRSPHQKSSCKTKDFGLSGINPIELGFLHSIYTFTHILSSWKRKP